MDIRELRCGDYTATINLSRGANCVSLRHRSLGACVLREPPNDSSEWDNPYLYGMPILFPVNRISGGQFTFDGYEYRLPINEPQTGCHLHGTLHQTPFVAQQQDERSICCVYRSNGEYSGFPQDFEIRICYEVGETGFTQTTHITNFSAQRLPLLLGFHTTFALPFVKGSDPDQIRIGAEVGELVERNMCNYIPTGRLLSSDAVTAALNRTDFAPCSEQISRHYRATGAGTMTLWDPQSGVTVRYRNDAKYGWRLLYNGEANAFVCMEPQSCAVDCFNTPYPMHFAPVFSLAQGETETYISHISCEKEGEKYENHEAGNP